MWLTPGINESTPHQTKEKTHMPKYIFADGQVFVDEGTYSPLARKPKSATASVVFLMVQSEHFNQEP